MVYSGSIGFEMTTSYPATESMVTVWVSVPMCPSESTAVQVISYVPTAKGPLL